MNKSEFRAKRVVRKYQQKIEAEPAVVFPLLCPVREADWLDGWNYRLIYSDSGVAEQGCVFTSAEKGERDTIWLITKRDEAWKEIEFARISPDSRVGFLQISVQETDNRCSLVDISYTFTALNDRGNQFNANYDEERFSAAMRFWEKSMNHYLKTGQKLVRETK